MFNSLLEALFTIFTIEGLLEKVLLEKRELGVIHPLSKRKNLVVIKEDTLL
jgi:hypothetical protein